MRKSLSILILALFICGNPACKSQKKQTKLSTTVADNSRTSLDWNGTYQGILPCADCEGIKTELVIHTDLTYKLRTQYLGKDEKINETEGKFSWNDNGSQIKLDNKQIYQVGENRLFHLDKTGKRISGDLANQYILEKEKSGLTHKNWKLVSLNKKFIEGHFSQPYMILNQLENRLSGNTGCNNFFGTYEITDQNKLKLSLLGMTKMACIGDNPEQEFRVALENTVYYSLSEEELILKDENDTILATFRTDYFLQ